jgi:hypothetical protein
MKVRRVKMIERMFADIADIREIRKVQQLYDQGLKASAIVYMLRRIERKWQTFIKNESLPFNGMGLLKEPSERRMVKITYQGVSNYEAL